MNETNNREESGHGKTRKTAAALRRRGFEAVVFETAKERRITCSPICPPGETRRLRRLHDGQNRWGLKRSLRAAGHKVLWHWEAEAAERPRLLHEP